MWQLHLNASQVVVGVVEKQGVELEDGGRLEEEEPPIPQM